MQLYSRLKQYYKYLRAWKKLNSRKSLIRDNELTAKELDFYSKLIKKDDLCFDIGANIGDKTMLFLQLGAKVVAIEPQECCWRVLRRRFQNCNVSVESFALADKEGSMTLFIDRSHTLATLSKDWIRTVSQSGRFSGHNWAGKLSVRTTTLDNLIKKYGKPAFCKIDVEGAEYEVLKGLSQSVNIISIEFVSERIEPSIKCIDYLSKLGKAEFNYYLGGSMSFELACWVDSGRIKTILTNMEKKIDNYGELYIRFVDNRNGN